MNDEMIFAIERPHSDLLKLYFLRALLTGPAFFFTFPVLFFRYHTLKYHFDEEGVSMGWGILFRRQINLTYARIQDIHLESSFIQRWFGLADIQIQTASGNASAEMVIEGIPEYEEVRNFLYGKMRGLKAAAKRSRPTTENAAIGDDDAMTTVLADILNELKATREAIQGLGDVPKPQTSDSQNT